MIYMPITNPEPVKEYDWHPVQAHTGLRWWEGATKPLRFKNPDQLRIWLGPDLAEKCLSQFDGDFKLAKGVIQLDAVIYLYDGWVIESFVKNLAQYSVGPSFLARLEQVKKELIEIFVILKRDKVLLARPYPVEYSKPELGIH